LNVTSVAALRFSPWMSTLVPADPAVGGAGEHGCLAVVGGDDPGCRVGAVVPFVAVGLELGPVAVGERAGCGADAPVGCSDALGDRGVDSVSGDDDAVTAEQAWMRRVGSLR
jgi:hypothetical protein